ncbi:MAG: hypothetical protein H6835_11440 [Planctomycetes bacterium]|nr:hypothetical protein [Planctomycetota bacterium]
MLKLDRKTRSFSSMRSPSLAEAGVLERADLQSCIANSSEAFFAEVGERLFLIGQEVVPSTTVADRIDLLAADPEGAIVIVELKRGSNKLHMLQAISYAGMLAHWEADEFRSLMPGDRWDALCDFLEVDVEDLNRRQRILLVAEAYDYALLSGAEWLSERHGVDLRCCTVSLATDPTTGAEYLACASVYPPPALAEQSVARTRSGRGTRPPKWSAWDEAIDAIENRDLAEFARREIEAGREKTLRRRSLHYRLDGKRRWSLSCRAKTVYVWQRGRFDGDVGFWQRLLSDPQAVTVVRKGKALSLSLATKGEFEAFGRAVTGDLSGLAWIGREVDDEDGQE